MEHKIETKTFEDKLYYVITPPDGTISLKLTWVATYDTEGMTEEEKDDLPGEEHDPDKDCSPHYSLSNDEMALWFHENIKSPVLMDISNFYFESQEDAMAFKLAWL